MGRIAGRDTKSGPAWTRQPAQAVIVLAPTNAPAGRHNVERLSVGAGAAYSDVEYAIHRARYLPLRDLVRGKIVLDACCGEGYGSHIMSSEWGAKGVTGVDISAAAIATAAANFFAPGLCFVQSPLEDYLASAAAQGIRFDAIVSVETLEHLADPAAALGGFKAILRTGGMIYVTVPNDGFYFGEGRRSLNKYHRHVFDFGAAKSLCEGVLGRGDWAMGTVTSGFSTFRLDDVACAEVFEPSLTGTVRPGIIETIPALPGTMLEPGRALYYAGFWDFGGTRSIASASVVYPSGAGYRMARLDHVASTNGRPLRVAMVADVPGWAFDNIAKNICSVLRERVAADIIYSGEMSDNSLFRTLFIDSAYDHVHFLWREVYLQFFFDDAYAKEIISGLAKNLGCDRSIAIERLVAGVGRLTVTFGVFDHAYLGADAIRSRRAGVALADGYTVSSSRLAGLYGSAYATGPAAVTPDGVDRALFEPRNLGRFSDADRPLVIGWVGNSEWGNEIGDDPKGVETIIRPTIARLAREGLAVVANFADRKERWRPRSEMPAYYHEIDVLLCASATEGTPNPVLEAMACGVPVISTDVGVVPEVFGQKQREFIVSRDVSSMEDAIRRLYLNRGLLAELSQENLQRVEHWDWIDFATNWCQLFVASHDERIRGRGLARTLYLRARCETLELMAENAALKKQHIDGLACIEGSLRNFIDLAARGQDARLEAIETSLRTIQEVASWQRKMLRPVRWAWVKALPIRRLVALARGRRAR